jgi:GDP-L-fucose synthase
MPSGNTRVLVTGGTGFIGKHVSEALSRAGLAPVSMGSGYDLRNLDRVNRVFYLADPEVVIHLAAVIGGVQRNEREPATMFYDNTLMSLNVARLCAEKGIPLVMTGTPCSYPKDALMPLKEEYLWQGYPASPNDGYGVSKLAILGYMDALHHQYSGWKSIYLIPFNTYGPGDHFETDRSHVIPGIIDRVYTAKAGDVESVEVWGHPSTTRSFVYVEDVAGAFVKAVDVVGYHTAPRVEVYNVGSSEETTIEELCVRIAEVLKYTGHFVFDPTRPRGHARRMADTMRARDLLGWKASTSLHEGLRMTVEWYVSQRKHI